MQSLVGRSQDAYAVIARRKRVRNAILISLGCLVVIAAVLAGTLHFLLNRQYNSYTVSSTKNIKNSDSMKFLSYNNGVLRYSRDGAAAITRDGKEQWNGSYDMENPEVDIAGQYVVVADIEGKTLYVFNGSDSGTQMTMDQPILQACVSKQGVVAVLLEQNDSNVIQIYNPYDANNKLLVEIPTNVEEGYPVSMDLAEDGTGLVASFVCVTSGTVQSRVAFYDFTDVGKNTNCLVGAKEYKDRVISEVRYLGADHACLFSEKGFSVWENMKKPKEKMHKEWKQTILSAYCNEDYVGAVVKKDTEGKADMLLYSLNGKQILKREISSEYTKAELYGDEIYIRSAKGCAIYRKNGVRKWNCSMKDEPDALLPTKGMRNYLMCKDGKMQLIKLSKKTSSKKTQKSK